MQIQNCIYCHKDKFRPYFKLNNITLSECLSCKTINLNPRPTEEEYEALYRSQYYKDRFETSELLDPIYETQLKSDAAKRLTKIKTIRQTGKLLEIGSGYGHFLKTASENGFEITGIELSKDGIEYSKNNFNISVSDKLLSSDLFLPNTFDIICMFHVFEHLTNPREILKICFDILKPGGILIFEIPNISYVKYFSSNQHKIDSLHYPYHVGFYTAHTLYHHLLELHFSSVKVEQLEDLYYSENSSFMKKLISKTLNKLGTSGLLWTTAVKPLP